MAIGLVGNAATDRDSFGGGGYTYIDKVTPATIRGIIKEVKVYIASGTGSSKIKIFRDDGTNYLFIRELSVSLSTALNTISAWLAIEQNDLIAFYSASCAIDMGSSGGSLARKSGDITTDSTKATWSSFSNPLSIYGSIFTRTMPITI